MHRSKQETKLAPTVEPVSTDTPVVTDQSGSPQAYPDPVATNDSIGWDLLNVVRGFCMGAADTVPGVSGGTVALILGHYQRLITAISRVDSVFLGLLAKVRLREAAAHIDGRFLLALGIGIAGGIVSLAGLMHWLLETRMSETFAVFFGLVLASVWIVRSYIDRWTASRVFACLGGIAFAVGISVLPASSGSVSLPYLFLSACVAICAMILPGISGAFVLLLFGVYHPVTGLIKDAAKGHVTLEGLTQMAVFGAGCAFGLLAFSRLLRWMLEHYRGATMAALMGLMIGSVAKLWPLQMPTPETADLEMKHRVLQYVAPAEWSGSLITLFALAAGAAIVVLVIEKLGAGLDDPSES
jgi:putative membrane protein